jgi:hypothetical protein
LWLLYRADASRGSRILASPAGTSSEDEVRIYNVIPPHQPSISFMV